MGGIEADLGEYSARCYYLLLVFYYNEIDPTLWNFWIIILTIIIIYLPLFRTNFRERGRLQTGKASHSRL
jgi:hypothetical protein